LEKINKYAAESIGVNTASMYQSMRIILTSMIATFEFIRNQTNIIALELIKLAKQTPYFKILVSIKGISDILAAQFIAECGDIKRFNHYKQIEKFSGFNLRIQQSGNYASSNHIHKMGNKRLSRVIYQATEKAVQYIPEIRMKYISRKKIKNIYKKNIVACVPNLISMIFSLVQKNKDYELDHDKYKELCALETKFEFSVKDIKHYTPAEKGVYCRLKQVKTQQTEN
jgi:hypothetical protein